MPAGMRFSCCREMGEGWGRHPCLQNLPTVERTREVLRGENWIVFTRNHSTMGSYKVLTEAQLRKGV